MENQKRSDLLDELLGSYLKIPVTLYWEKASGLPFPDRFEGARAEFQGIATAWLNLEQIVCQAQNVRFIHGLPARLALEQPSVELALGQAEVDRWLKRFELPYRLELGADGLVIHAEIAGFPVAKFETRIDVVGGWFVLKPKSASIFGMPSYVSSIFRSYLPIPPLSSESRLEDIVHAEGSIRLKFALDDFEEEVSPGLLTRLRKRFFPIADQISDMLSSGSP